MKTTNRNWLYPFIIIMGLLCLAGFCKKEEDEDTPGAITDKDGNSYTTVTIGTHVWMVENLKTTKYNNGTDIPLVTDNIAWSNLTTPGYCWYDNNTSTYKTPYGALYNWYAVNTGKLCPTGWHVPSEAEWTTLMNFCGPNQAVGNKLKEAGTTHWTSSPHNGETTNETGFSALPGGLRYGYDPGTFRFIGSTGEYWTSTEYSTTIAKNSAFGAFDGMVYIYKTSSKQSGYSVRCIKD